MTARRTHLRALSAILLTVVMLVASAVTGVFGSTASAAGNSAAEKAAAKKDAAKNDPVLYRFVSMPDFINADIGDVSTLPTWVPGDPNSTNEHYHKAIGAILDAVQSERPAFMLDAGDLVEGHWVRDVRHTGIFGPMTTQEEMFAAVTAAGQFYYKKLKQRFASRGLPFYPAVGDHDIGDNPWPAGSDKLAAVPTHMAAFAKAFTHPSDGTPRFAMHPDGPSATTAYAFRFKDTLFVTVDDFYDEGDQVALTLDPDQMTWLRQLLTTARQDGVVHIIVQGHLPALGSTPPQIPSQHSSRQFLDGGATSPFWRLLKRTHVDAYLAGEMHDISERFDGVTQVVSGAPLGKGIESYVVGTVYADKVVLTVKKFDGAVIGVHKMWQISGRKPSQHPVYPTPPHVVGQYVIPTYQPSS